MLTLFRTNQILGNIFVLFYLIILRIGAFIHPIHYTPTSPGILSGWIYQLAPPASLGSEITATLLVFIQAIMINQLCARYRFFKEVTLLPGAIYCLITSLMPEFLSLSPLLMGATFLICATFCLFGVYKNSRCADTIFDVGLWIGIASLFQFSFSVFLIWSLIGLSVLRNIELKEFLMALLGWTAPNFLMIVYLFWHNNLPLFFQNHISDNIGFLNIIKGAQAVDYIKTAIIGVIIIFTIILSGRFYSKKNIDSQKYISLIFWLLFFSATTLLWQANFRIEHLLILSVPLALLLSLALQSVNLAFAEVLHTLLFVSALLMQYEYMLV